MTSNHQRLAEIKTKINALTVEKEEIENHIETEKTGVERYLERYSGQQLLKDHNLTETGIWKVYGEDPNCDFGGSHHEPFLGNFEGSLEQVLEYAVQMPRFWQWGAGGRIEKAKEPVVIKL
jgi:hypothetical protein